MRLRPLGRDGVDGHVVQPAAELRRALGGVVGHQDPVHGLPGRDRPDPCDHVVPLVDVEDLRRALPPRGQREAVLVGGAQLAQPGAVGEGEVDGDVGRVVVEVAVRHRREDPVRQPRVPADGHVHVEDLVVRVRPPVGGVPTRVPQGPLSGEPGTRLRGRGAARPAVDEGEHVLRDGPVTAARGQLEVGELEEVTTVVAGDLQPEVPVLGGFRQVVRPGLEPLREGLARAGVERLPVRAVGGTLQGPVLRVPFVVVVGRRQCVTHHFDRFIQFELGPAGGLEGEPLGARLAVDEILLHLAAAGVLGAGPDVGDVVGDVARYAAAVAAVHARGPLAAVRCGVDGVLPVRNRVVRLEGGRELPVGGLGGLGQCDRDAL